MLGIGTSELILILILALLIIGPKDLPRIGREVGRVFRNFQKAADDVKESITREIDIAGREVDDAIEKDEVEKKQ